MIGVTIRYGVAWRYPTHQDAGSAGSEQVPAEPTRPAGEAVSLRVVSKLEREAYEWLVPSRSPRLVDCHDYFSDGRSRVESREATTATCR
jgi:hypothetical protein